MIPTLATKVETSRYLVAEQSGENVDSDSALFARKHD